MSAKIWNKLFKRKTPKNEVVVDYEKCAKVKVKEEWNDNNSNNSDGKNQTTIVFGDSATATTPPQCQSKAATLKYIPPPGKLAAPLFLLILLVSSVAVSQSVVDLWCSGVLLLRSTTV